MSRNARGAALVVAVAGRKGGAGKSTVALNLAAEGVRRGLDVLLVDADLAQGTARVWGAVAGERGLPSPTLTAMGATMHRPGQLERLAATCGLVIIDCAPRIDDAQKSALLAADVVLLPCGASPADVWALAEGVALVETVRLTRPALRAAIVLNRLRRTSFAAELRGALADTGLPVLAATLRQRAAYERAMAAGEGVTTFEPRGEAAAEVRALFDEVFKLGGRKVNHGK